MIITIPGITSRGIKEASALSVSVYHFYGKENLSQRSPHRFPLISYWPKLDHMPITELISKGNWITMFGLE